MTVIENEPIWKTIKRRRLEEEEEEEKKKRA